VPIQALRYKELIKGVINVRKILSLLCGFDALELFAGFEADGLAGWDADFFAGAGVAADAGLAWFDAEDAKAPEFDPYKD
jgi:hypothetical protein